MAGGAETPNIAALPAIARLGTCESARGPDADRHVKLLSQFAVEGSLSGAYSQRALFQTQCEATGRPLYGSLKGSLVAAGGGHNYNPLTSVSEFMGSVECIRRRFEERYWIVS